MELFTSYWQNPNLVENGEVLPVGISRGTLPGMTRKKKTYDYKRLGLLAPSDGLYDAWKAGEIDEEAYTRIYRTQLERIGLEKIQAQLTRKAREGDKPLVLLCFEKPGEFCHRRLFAGWYREKTGQIVPELGSWTSES